MLRRTTLDDVARAAGVSAATVSRALRDMPNVAATTRRRIRRIAADLGYEPNAASGAIGERPHDDDRPGGAVLRPWYASQVVAGAEAVLSARGEDLLVHAVDTPRNRAGSSPGLRRWAAASTASCSWILRYRSQAHRLRLAGKPIVTGGERIAGFDSITIDNRGGAAMATDHLIALGHTRIALITGVAVRLLESPAPQERHAGYAGRWPVPGSRMTRLS